MNQQNWRIEQTGEDYFRHQKKQVALGDRRPVIRQASDLVGPGIAAQAIRLTDFNDVLATFNGFFSGAEDALNAPSSTEGFVGYVSSDAELGGFQLFVGLETGTVYRRVFTRNPSDASALYWGAWDALASGGGGGGTGIVETIQEGANITVDDSDPANPIVSATVPSAIGQFGGQIDTFTVSGSGPLDFYLTYVPLEMTLHVKWGSNNIPSANWSLVNNVLTVEDPHWRVDDKIECEYLYDNTSSAPTPDDPPPPPPPVSGNLVDFESSGWSWLAITRGDDTDYSASAFDDSGWAVADAPFGQTTPADSMTNFEGVTWPLYVTEWTQGTRMWGRRDIAADAGTGVSIAVRWNKGVKVYWNGVFLYHGTCISAGEHTIDVPGASVLATNVLAVQITDEGGSHSVPPTGCYFDTEVAQ